MERKSFRFDNFTEKIIMVIATGMLHTMRFEQTRENETFMPPSIEEVMEKFNNSAEFNRAVLSMVSEIQRLAESEYRIDRGDEVASDIRIRELTPLLVGLKEHIEAKGVRTVIDLEKLKRAVSKKLKAKS